MNDFLRADSLASACAYKSSFTREWELTGLTGILQQIIFSQLVSKSKSVWGFSHTLAKAQRGVLLWLGAGPQLWCHSDCRAGAACFKRLLEPWHSQASLWKKGLGGPLKWWQQVDPFPEDTHPKPLHFPGLFSGCWPCVQRYCSGGQEHQLLILIVLFIHCLTVSKWIDFLLVFSFVKWDVIQDNHSGPVQLQWAVIWFSSTQVEINECVT